MYKKENLIIAALTSATKSRKLLLLTRRKNKDDGNWQRKNIYPIAELASKVRTSCFTLKALLCIMQHTFAKVKPAITKKGKKLNGARRP